MSDGSDADADVSDYERGRRSYFARAPATRTPSEGLISAKKCRSILELGKLSATPSWPTFARDPLSGRACSVPISSAEAE